MNTIVTETTEQGEVGVDIFQKLSDDRILFIFGDINDEIAADISATLLLRDGQDSNRKITIFINSQGGNIRDALAIYDVMCIVESPIEMVCIGSAMKEAAILLASGTPGLRLATKNSVISVGQLVNDWMKISDLTDAKTALSQSLDDNKRMMEIFAKTAKKPMKQILHDFERQVFMGSQEALQYGFIDRVIKSRKSR